MNKNKTQEKHHYVNRIEWTPLDLDEVKRRDAKKLELAASKGITLILIPCWWDGTMETLIATIDKYRPDLQLLLSRQQGDGSRKAVLPVDPENPPPRFFENEVTIIEGIGQPTEACFFTRSHVDPKDW